MKKGLVVFFTIMGLFEAGIVNASVFYIDQFTVKKTDDSVTTTYFQDTFSGAVPKDFSVEPIAAVDVNPENRAYLLPYPQLPGPEAGGKLALDTADGKLNLSPISNNANLFLGARVNSSQANGSAALWKDDQFIVEALFDLTLMTQQPGERYGIRITDWTSTTQTEDIEITLLRRTDGEFRILFRQADFVTGGLDLIQGWNPTNNPNFGEFEKISLSIFNDPSNLDMFFAKFTLFDIDNIFNDVTRTSSSTGQMFQISDWVRPEFFAVRFFTVPEPMSLALIGLGLAGIGYQRRKQIKAA